MRISRLGCGREDTFELERRKEGLKLSYLRIEDFSYDMIRNDRIGNERFFAANLSEFAEASFMNGRKAR